jgi:hypothetical protein
MSIVSFVSKRCFDEHMQNENIDIFLFDLQLFNRGCILLNIGTQRHKI